MSYSLIITSWKEPLSITKQIENILNPENYLKDLEILIVCPDEETFLAAEKVCLKNKFKNYRWLKDPAEGKPKALNMAVKEAKGDIWIFTDGDILVDKDSLPKLISLFSDQKTGGISGRPISIDEKSNFFGYIGHLLADAAHEERKKRSNQNSFYFLSGYLYAMRKIPNLIFPEDILVDDAWITLKILEQNKTIAYSPDSNVFIYYPKNLKDWINQKKRSVGGYRQLKNYIFDLKLKRPDLNFTNRTLLEELKYIVFPLKYAHNIKEMLFSFILYPMRLYLWFRIWIETHFIKKDLKEIWVRIESTKS